MASNDDKPGEGESRRALELFLEFTNSGPQYICNLCHEFVSRNQRQTRVRYGLLQNCDHVFCLCCIRRYVLNKLALERHFWPSNQLHGYQIKCPVCETPSFYLMASESMITDPALKAQYVRDFVENMRIIKCVFHRRGLGACFCNDQVNHDNI